MDGQHHLFLRKRMHERMEPFPSPNALKRLLDKVMLFAALAGPAAMLPQVYQVYASQDAKGLSLFTWLVWTVLAVIWTLYGIVHKEIPILIANAIYVVLQLAVVLGILLYS